MPVLSDYNCPAHGYFEAFEPKCPHGCSPALIQKVFLKAPGLRSDRTKGIDKTLSGLAEDYGLTDLNNQNGTSAVVRPDPRKLQERNQLVGKLGDTSGMWGAVSPGGTYKVGAGPQSVDGRAGNGALATVAENHVMPGNALETVAPILTPPKPQVMGRFDAKIDAGAAE